MSQKDHACNVCCKKHNISTVFSSKMLTMGEGKGAIKFLYSPSLPHWRCFMYLRYMPYFLFFSTISFNSYRYTWNLTKQGRLLWLKSVKHIYSFNTKRDSIDSIKIIESKHIVEWLFHLVEFFSLRGVMLVLFKFAVTFGRKIQALSLFSFWSPEATMSA